MTSFAWYRLLRLGSPWWLVYASPVVAVVGGLWALLAFVLYLTLLIPIERRLATPTVRRIWYEWLTLPASIRALHPKLGPPVEFAAELSDLDQDMLRRTIHQLRIQPVTLDWNYCERITGAHHVEPR